jgi:hypothetical protein
MKKLLTLSVLALAASALSARPAHAWSNIRFNVGLNLHWQAADNSLLWGLFRNGPAPGPCCQPNPYAAGNPYGPTPYPYFDPTGMMSSRQPGMVPGQGPATGPGPAGPPATAQTPVPTAPPPAPSASPQATGPVFQPVGYSGTASTSFSSPAAATSGGTVVGRAPSYWYSR